MTINPKKVLKAAAAAIFMIFWCLFPENLGAVDRFQIELFGGISATRPGDLNLLPEAQQQYNEFYFIEPYRWMRGYFLNDFPKIHSLLPGGVRLRFRVSGALSASMAVEGYTRTREERIEGDFTYSYSTTTTETHSLAYDPYRIGVTGYALLGGLHYRLSVGSRTDLEVGAAAGWAAADFEFSSTWTRGAAYESPYISHRSEENGTLEGDGSGNGFMAQGMLRLNRMLSSRLGFFVEAAYTHCRIRSLEGSGREIRSSLPGEISWQGTWGIKREEIRMSWGDTAVSVPTNFWDEEWVAAQRESDFILDLSGLRMTVGICFRF